MLTPIELQNRQIKSGRGYHKKEMDEFLEEVYSSYEELYKENIELKDKVSTLSDGIQYYKSIETTLQKALILAEKTSKETKDAALLKAEAIEKDAHTKANIIISEAKKELDQIQNKCVALVQQYNQFKLQFKQITNTQLELINSEVFKIYTPDLNTLFSSKTGSIEDSIDSTKKEQKTGEDAATSDEKPNDIPVQSAVENTETFYFKSETDSVSEPEIQTEMLNEEIHVNKVTASEPKKESEKNEEEQTIDSILKDLQMDMKESKSTKYNSNTFEFLNTDDDDK